MDATRLIEEIRQHTNQHGLAAALAQYAPTLASWPGENAACWFRVSPGPGQNEALQVPQVLRYCAENNLRPVKFYVVHAVSAFHGKHQADLDRAVDDARHGEFSTLVIWHSDRIERRKGKALLDTLAEFTDAGCQVVSEQEPQLGKTDFGSQVVTFIAGLVNNEKVEHIKEQVKLAQDEIAANNATGNRIPWGYFTDGPKLNRKLYPTEDCKKWVPLIFQHCIEGWSCARIAAWLDSEGVPTSNGQRWHEGSIRHLIKNATYAGRRIRRPKNGETVGETFQLCPEAAVIDMDMWTQANEAMSNREKRGPKATTVNPIKPLLAKLHCARCGAPMYRNLLPRSKQYEYRCAGKAPQRKGCGNRVPFNRLETRVVVRILTWRDEPYQITKWAKGTNWDAEIANTVQSLQELPKGLSQGELMVAEYNQRHAELMTQLADYQYKNEHEATAGHLEYVDILNDDGSVKTKGQHFFELDREGRREFLRTYDIRAEKSEKAADGIRLIIDGEECEPNPFETALLNTVPPELVGVTLESQIPNAAEWQALLRGERIPGSENI